MAKFPHAGSRDEANQIFRENSKFSFTLRFLPEKPQYSPRSLRGLNPPAEFEIGGMYTSLGMYTEEYNFGVEGKFTLEISVGTEMVQSSILVKKFNSAVQSAADIRQEVLKTLEEALAEAKVNYDLVEGAVLALKGQGVYENHAWYENDRQYVGMCGGRMRYQWQVKGNKLVLFASKHGIPRGLDGYNYPPTPTTAVEFERHINGAVSYELILGFKPFMSEDERDATRTELDTFQYAS